MAFHTNKDGHTIYEAVRGMIPARGISQKALIAEFGRKHGKDWNPTSCSPSLTFLERIGAIERSGGRGNKSLKPVRAYDRETDNRRIADEMRDYQNGRRNEKREHPHKGNGALPFRDSTKMLFAVGDKETVVLSMRDAKRLWQELNVVFGAK